MNRFKELNEKELILLKEAGYVVEENKEVWNRISVGSITVNYKKKTVEQTKNTEQK